MRYVLASFEVFWRNVLSMNMDDELTVIDAFEERYGSKHAMDRACEFLISYLSLTSANLPEIAKHGLEIATRYPNGGVGLAELQAERTKLATFLSERSAWTAWRHPDFGPIHSVYAILWHLEDPTRGGGASELISNALEATEAFRPDDEIVRTLVKNVFQA
jgi:hypothetical protein